MNKKGFTLVELLATITIIGIICVVIFPSVSNLIKGNEKTTAEEIGKMMISSAKKYVNNEKMEGTGCYSIKAKELIEKDLLQTINVNQLKCDTDNSFVRIDFTSKAKKYSYHLSCTSKKESKTFDTSDTTVTYCDNFIPTTKGKIAINNKMYPPDLGARKSEGANEFGFDKKRNTVIPKNSNLVPIRYYKDKWVKADVTNKKSGYYWYDYNNAMWANMAIVKKETAATYYNAKPGTEVYMDDMISMWVWIPRFSYYIQATKTAMGNVYNDSKIKFIDISTKEIDKTENDYDKCRYSGDKEAPNDKYCTPEAFTSVDGKELSGFWFSKFEAGTECDELEVEDENKKIKINPFYNTTSSKDLCKNNANTMNKPLYIKPSLCAYICQGYIEAFNKTKTMENDLLLEKNNQIDIHMIRNNEWSAVLYLAFSKYGNSKIESSAFSHYNKEGESTLAYNTLTGATSIFLDVKNYNHKDILKTSTTGNIYGIYDMNGRDTYTTSYYQRISNAIWENSSTGKESRYKEIDNTYKKYFVDESTTSTNSYNYGQITIDSNQQNNNNRIFTSWNESSTYYDTSIRTKDQITYNKNANSFLIDDFPNTEAYNKYKDGCENSEGYFTISYEIEEAIRIRNYNKGSYRSLFREFDNEGKMINKNLIHKSYLLAQNTSKDCKTNLIPTQNVNYMDFYYSLKYSNINYQKPNETKYTTTKDSEAATVFRPALYFNE